MSMLDLGIGIVEEIGSMTKRSPRHSQKGSVLIYILIAVALFAALAMVVSSMMRGSTTIGN